MALWNSGATWSSGILWGPAAAPSPSPENTRRKPKHTMKRQPYYPKKNGDQSEWHTNFATKLPTYASALALSPEEVNNAVADYLYLAYGLGGWIRTVRDHGTSCTQSLETLAFGTGSTNYVFPAEQLPPLPTLPVGILGVKPGALQRTFDLVGIIKRKPGYDDAIGLDLGIVGPEAPPPPPMGEAPVPRLTVKAVPGTANEAAVGKFYKDGHEYVVAELRINGGAWLSLGMYNKSPFRDDRPLLVPGQAEVREYRARFYDKGGNSSGWCDVTKVTIGP